MTLFYWIFLPFIILCLQTKKEWVKLNKYFEHHYLRIKSSDRHIDIVMVHLSRYSDIYLVKDTILFLIYESMERFGAIIARLDRNHFLAIT